MTCVVDYGLLLRLFLLNGGWLGGEASGLLQDGQADAEVDEAAEKEFEILLSSHYNYGVRGHISL
jgi:hypothetical protein